MIFTKLVRHDGGSLDLNPDEFGNIWIQELDQLDPRQLAGIDGAEAPFWSPDGQEIGFFQRNQIWRVPVAGGQKKLICDMEGEVASGRGAY